jgi:hypothetical protein
MSWRDMSPHPNRTQKTAQDADLAIDRWNMVGSLGGRPEAAGREENPSHPTKSCRHPRQISATTIPHPFPGLPGEVCLSTIIRDDANRRVWLAVDPRQRIGGTEADNAFRAFGVGREEDHGQRTIAASGLRR